MNDDEYLTLQQRCEKAEADRDRLQHIIDCSNTPLMRDVLAERDSCSRVASVQSRLTFDWMNKAKKVEAERDALHRSIASWKREELEWDAERTALRAKLEKCRRALETIRWLLAQDNIVESDGIAHAALAETKEEEK
jgi:hypothetical protein